MESATRVVPPFLLYLFILHFFYTFLYNIIEKDAYIQNGLLGQFPCIYCIFFICRFNIYIFALWHNRSSTVKGRSEEQPFKMLIFLLSANLLPYAFTLIGAPIYNIIICFFRLIQLLYCSFICKTYNVKVSKSS